MKTILFCNNISRKFHLSISLFLSVLFLLSCTKNSEDAELITGGNQLLQIKVIGIEEPLDLMATSTKSNTQTDEENLQSLKNSNISYTKSFTSAHYTQNAFKNQIKSSLNKNKKFANASSGSSINYRLILFLKKGNSYTYVGHKDKTSSSEYAPTNLQVLVGGTYKWVAYSYNNDAPLTDDISATNLSITTSIDKDLLYASNDITIPNSSERISVDIRFKHSLARLAITLKADEFPAQITNTAGSSNI